MCSQSLSEQWVWTAQPQAFVILHTIPPATVETAIVHPGVIIASDAVPYDNGAGHPRGTGTFARVLGVYVREKKVLRLEEAIRKMTSLPATTFRFAERGELHPGYWADLAVFNPETIADPTTYLEPEAGPVGIELVLINGEIVLEDGRVATDTKVAMA